MSDYKVLEYDLEQIQDAIFDIAIEIDRICKKNNITYFLSFGTLLGAVRHKGFIPWDDDFDISMLREDYNKFLTLCDKQLSRDFILVTSEKYNQYPFNFAKIMKKGTVFLEKRFQYKKIPSGIYVDIFPLDLVNVRTYGLQRRLVSALRRARWYSLDKKTIPYDVWKKSELRKETRLFAPFSIIGERNLDRLINCIISMSSKSNNGYLYVLTHPDGKKRLFRTEWFKEAIEMKFRDRMLLCPIGYKKILRQSYGEYMTLPKKELQQPEHEVLEIKL